MKIAICALCWIMLAGASARCNATVVTRKATPNTIATGFDLSPFDMNVTKLPAHYKGDDVVGVCNAFVMDMKIKDQFETTEEYDRRVAAAEKVPLVGKLLPTSTFAFVDTVDPDVYTKYDADNQSVSVVESCLFQNYMMELPAGWSEDATHHIEVYSTGKDDGNVSYRNGFGATFTVDKLEINSYDIIFPNFSEFYSKYPGDDIYSLKLSFPMATSVAKATMPDMRLLLVCTLTSNRFALGFHDSEVTMDSSYAFSYTYYYLETNLLELWVFNQRTGEIYMKAKPAP